MKFFNRLILITALTGSMLFISCGDDDGMDLTTLGVAFETTGLGITETEPTAEVNITFSRSTAIDSEIIIDVTEQLVEIGTDYTTNPAISNGQIILSVPAESASVSFSVTRSADLVAAGSSVTFTLTSITGEEDTQLSGNTSVVVSFEAINSPGANLDAQIGGPTEPNQVFVDFSQNQQTTAERVSWDLGFFGGADDKVIVNYSTYTMAQALTATDLNSVTAADTVGFAAQMVIGTIGANSFIDDPDGDLNKLVFSDVSATDSENVVYIINRGAGPGTGNVDPGSVDVSSTPRGWKKVRILKDGDDYIVQHADIDATSFEETRITKDPSYNFNYFSFEAGAVNVEPVKSQWDIVFTVSSNIIDFGGGPGAYGFSDFVLSNRQGGAEVALIGAARDAFGSVIDEGPGVAYEDFTTADLTEDYVNFTATANTIGSGWRSVFSGTAYTDVFFLVRDPDGNTYKVKFLGLLDENGNRGNSSLQFELL